MVCSKSIYAIGFSLAKMFLPDTYMTEKHFGIYTKRKNESEIIASFPCSNKSFNIFHPTLKKIILVENILSHVIDE